MPRSLERHADPHAALPDHAASLAGRAVEHLEATRQVDEFLQLQAGTPGGVIDQDALDRRRARSKKELGDAGYPALGTHACVQSGMLLHDRELFSDTTHTSRV